MQIDRMFLLLEISTLFGWASCGRVRVARSSMVFTNCASGLLLMFHAILLLLILIVHLLPSQSNDEVFEVFAPMGDAGDDPLCYILEK